jgi:Choline-glycine betaine transporter
MGALSNVNALLYVLVILFVLIFGGVNRLLGLYFTSVSDFILNYVPLVGFSDPILQTGWQENNSMFFYSWNAMPGLLAAFFYASVSYGRKLKEFVLVNCLVPTVFMTFWYVFVGGTAIFGVMEGSGLDTAIAEHGSGIATFAFLDTLPLGTLTKWFFIIMAMITFVTWADAICYSFPLMFMKHTEKDASNTKTPKILVAGTAVFMGLLTITLVYVGGYDAMETSILCWGLPSSLLIVLLVISCIKFLLQRKRYDLTYLDELAGDKASGINTKESAFFTKD